MRGPVVDYTADDLRKALRPIESLLSKSEKALQRLSQGTWQHAMLRDNVRALQIASKLMDPDAGEAGATTQENLREALPSLASMIAKSEQAQARFSPGMAQHTLLRNRINALRIADALMRQALNQANA